MRKGAGSPTRAAGKEAVMSNLKEIYQDIGA
jgi:hypothetical protein